MQRDGFVEGVELVFRGQRGWAVHFRFDAHRFGGVGEAGLGFLPVGDVDVGGNEVILLILLVIRLFACDQAHAQNDE